MVRQVNGRSQATKPLFERVAVAIDSIRRVVQVDGGDIELLKVDPKGVVWIRLHGACIGCPSSPLTVTLGIERNLKEQVPEVARVICS